MKVWIAILFFCSFSSHGLEEHPLFSRQSLNNTKEALDSSLSTREALQDLRKVLKEYIDSLALVLLDDKTPVTNQKKAFKVGILERRACNLLGLSL